MKKPLLGWPKYKKKRKHNPAHVHYGWLGGVFIFWGVLGLLTSWHFNNALGKQEFSFRPKSQTDLWGYSKSSTQPKDIMPFINKNTIGPPSKPVDLSDDGLKQLVDDLSKAAEEQAFESKEVVLPPQNIVGPIKVTKARQVYEIAIKANLPVQSWSFIEGEVLDEDKEYLFSFGKELWHETGRDSEGPWRENKNTIKTKVSFRHPGTYYLNFKIESNKKPSHVRVTATKKIGSALPHFWFGLITLIIGLVFNEKKNKTICITLDALD